MLKPAIVEGSRSLFIETAKTPNANALKFLPGQPVLPKDVTSSFLEYTSRKDTISPPYKSPLAAKLIEVDGVSKVFFGPDFITVTKQEDAKWPHVKPDVFSIIQEELTSGTPVVKFAGDQSAEAAQTDSLSYDENDPEVVGMIKELLETRIRPAIQEDGGDIDYVGFEDGQVLVRLRGSCEGCAQSAVTLKNGIEGMLMHYVYYLYNRLIEANANHSQIEEVKGVTQVEDEAEKISKMAFDQFEEKLEKNRNNPQMA